MRTGTAAVVVLLALCPTVFGRGKKSGDRLPEAVNKFSVDLLKDVFSGGPKNLVISPVSVSTVLAMLDQGAKGNTSKQIESAIHLNKRKARLLYGRLSHNLKEQENSSAKLEVANHLFVARKFHVRPRYSELLQSTYLSGIERTTFGNGDGAKAINSWVRNATHDQIDSIVDPVLPSNIAMVIVNAMFFQSPWLNPFKTSATSDMSFNLLDGSKITVPFMSKRGVFSIGNLTSIGATWIELPFLDQRFALQVLIPNELDGLSGLVQKISYGDISRVIASDSKSEVHLFMPRFSLSTKTDLIPPLKKLGVEDLFDDETANLSGVSKTPLLVSKAVQRAEMKIDEAGGLAAAATGFELEPRSYVDTITVDRPFLAMIVDKVRALPLFLCTIVDPSHT